MSHKLKKKIIRNNYEEVIKAGNALESEKEVNLIKNISSLKRNSIFPLYQKRIEMFEYEFLKTYLYAVYTETLKDDKLKIINYNALASSANPFVSAPDILCTDDKGLSIIENHCVFVNLLYEGSAYQVSVMLKVNNDGFYLTYLYSISVLGIDVDSYNTTVLTNYLIKQSIRNSFYKNKILKIKSEEEDKIDIRVEELAKLENEKLCNLFIPNQQKDELLKFRDCVLNYNNINYGLRYIFCGEPGTAKTKSVRTLINLCKDFATIIIVDGVVDFRALFYFASLFEPAVICIDDLDLFIGTREHQLSHESLSTLLQQLDGFDKNNIFLLATTNNKELVDKAASRPGRFDLVMDFGKISKENYMDLIKSSCLSPQILELFNKEVINSLHNKKVTGAFIVNLIKQLEIKQKLAPECDLKEYLNSFINLSYKGFYKTYSETELSFGFSSISEDGYDIR